MKASARIARAQALIEKAEALIDTVDQSLITLLDDPDVHVFWQQGDGWVVAFGGDLNNAALCHFDIDQLLKMSKDDALKALDSALL